jgi:hypothetical protein
MSRPVKLWKSPTVPSIVEAMHPTQPPYYAARQLLFRHVLMRMNSKSKARQGSLGTATIHADATLELNP